MPHGDRHAVRGELHDDNGKRVFARERAVRDPREEVAGYLQQWHDPPLGVAQQLLVKRSRQVRETEGLEYEGHQAAHDDPRPVGQEPAQLEDRSGREAVEPHLRRIESFLHAGHVELGRTTACRLDVRLTKPSQDGLADVRHGAGERVIARTRSLHYDLNHVSSSVTRVEGPAVGGGSGHREERQKIAQTVSLTNRATGGKRSAEPTVAQSALGNDEGRRQGHQSQYERSPPNGL